MINNYIISNSIDLEYQRLQIMATSNLINKQNEIYKLIPEIKEIDDEIRSLAIKYGKAAIVGLLSTQYNTQINELSIKIINLKTKRMCLLKSNGYPEDHMDIKYLCNKCKDTGFEKISNQQSRKCFCYTQKYINYLYNNYNFKILEKENFNLFNELLYSDDVNEAKYYSQFSPRQNIVLIKTSCMKFINNFDNPDQKNLFLSGFPGTGKTFLINCICRELLNKGKTIIYQTAPVIFDEINKKRFNSNKFEKEYSLDEIFDVDLLIIDDLGTENITPTRYADFITILNQRHIKNVSKSCKIIISTNMGFKQLEEFYTERIVSRIIGNFECYKLFGDDIRKMIKAYK